MDLVAGLFVTLLIALVVGGRLAGSRLRSPTAVRLAGRAPERSDWVARAVAKATPTFSKYTWTHTLDLVSPDDGPSYWEGEVSGAGGTYLVKITVPVTDPQQQYSLADPLLGIVHLQNYQYRSHWFQRLALGEYPDTAAVMVRSRAISQLRRQFAGGGARGFWASLHPSPRMIVVCAVIVVVTIVLGLNGVIKGSPSTSTVEPPRLTRPPPQPQCRRTQIQSLHQPQK